MLACACRCLGLPAALVIFVAQAFFLAAMDPMTPLLAATLAGVANLLGDILLVCGFGWGIAGAALATAVAQVCPHPEGSKRLRLLPGTTACMQGEAVQGLFTVSRLKGPLTQKATSVQVRDWLAMPQLLPETSDIWA